MQSFSVELRPIDVRNAREIEQAVAAFASSSNGGLVVPASPQATDHRDLIITLAARYKLPAIYFERSFVAAGGLISYGPNFGDEARRAAGMSIASSKARSWPTCQCRRRQNTNWSSI
jgi:putative ABC transport system substrate-binding protein